MRFSRRFWKRYFKNNKRRNDFKFMEKKLGIKHDLVKTPWEE